MMVSAMFHRASTVNRPVRPPRLTLCDTVALGCRPPSSNTAMRVPPTKYSQVLVACRAVSTQLNVTLLPTDVAGQARLLSLSTANRVPPPLHCMEPLGASTLCGS
jgi:hypothetical protein